MNTHVPESKRVLFSLTHFRWILLRSFLCNEPHLRYLDWTQIYQKASGSFSACLILAEFCWAVVSFVAGTTRTSSTSLLFMQKLSPNWKRSFSLTWTWTFMVSAFQLYVFWNVWHVSHLFKRGCSVAVEPVFWAARASGF